MASKITATLTLAGDSDSLSRELRASSQAVDKFEADARSASAGVGRAYREIGAEAQRMQREVRQSADSVHRFTEAADLADTRAMGFRDGVTGIQDSLGGMSAMARGPSLDSLLLLGMGFGDLSSSAANFAGPVLGNAIKRLGAARLALIGVAGAAGIAVAVLGYMALESRKTSLDVDKLNDSLDTLARTDIATGELRRVFGDNATAAGNFAGKLRQITDYNDKLGRTPGLYRDAFQWMANSSIPTFASIFAGDAEESRRQIESLDAALAQQVNSGLDAGAAQQLLASYMGETNYQYAVANGLLPQFVQATEDAAERNKILGAAVETTATSYRVAAQNLQTFMDLLRAQTDPIFAHTRAVNAAENVNKAYRDAVREHGANSGQARQAAADLASAQLDVFYADSQLAKVNEDELLPTLRTLEEYGYLSGDGMGYLTDELGKTEEAALRAQAALAGVQGRYPSVTPGGNPKFYDGGSGLGITINRHHSGLMSGPVRGDYPGQEVPILARAGEVVAWPSQLGGGQTIVYVNLTGDIREWLRADVAAGGGEVQVVYGS